MSQRASRMFVVLVGLGVASSAWAAGSGAVRTEKAVGPVNQTAVRTQKAVGPLGGIAVKSHKVVGPRWASAVHTDKAVGHDEKPASNGPLLDLNAGF